MLFQLDSIGPYHNIRMRHGDVLVVCDLYDSFLHSGYFSVKKDETFISYFRLKNPLFAFSERDFSAPKLLNH